MFPMVGNFSALSVLGGLYQMGFFNSSSQTAYEQAGSKTTPSLFNSGSILAIFLPRHKKALK